MSRKFTEQQLELLTAYTDGCTNEAETSETESLIASDPEYKALFELEKATKNLLKNRLKPIEPPSNLLQNIHSGLDEAYKNAKDSTTDRSQNTITSTIRKPDRNYTRFYYLGIAAAILIMAVVSFQLMNKLNSIPVNRNYELVSRSIFNKVEKGDMKVQHVTNDPQELRKFIESKANFTIFIPDINDAELIGGSVSEVEGQTLVHFVHKCKDGKLIYTMEGSKNLTMTRDHLILDEPCMNRILEGKNWFESKCGKDESNVNIVLWSKDDCLCSSVSKEDPGTITAVLNSSK
ncbi:hypothetical protein BH10BAC5_BH10BAC5_03510 [soil metagenome]